MGIHIYIIFLIFYYKNFLYVCTMIKQPENTKLCGHTCLANILKITLEEAIELIGHQRGTYGKELVQHFNSSKNKRGLPQQYSLCMLRHIDKKISWGHWILCDIEYGERIYYDPEIGQWLPESSYWEIMDYARITSHWNIL